MSAAFVILSGGYAGDLVAEFGHLPPSMLPNGGRPLYDAQCDMAEGLDARALLVLPHDYVVPEFDREHLTRRGVEIVVAPQEASAMDSLRAGLAAANGSSEAYLLFGDTLVPDRASWPRDSFAAGSTNQVAFWAEYRQEGNGCSFRERPPEAASQDNVVAGFFHFGDKRLLTDVAERSSDVVDLLNGYSAEHPLSPVTDATWLDFGHLFSYHQSRCRELLARSFNSVTSDGHSVVKSGTPARKIFAEAQWYKQLPARMLPFAPQFMGADEEQVSYEIEYLYLPLLSELYTFAHLPKTAWATILGSCRSFLELTQSFQPSEHQVPANYPQLFFEDMHGNKTRVRLEEFADSRNLSIQKTWTFNGEPYLSLQELTNRLTAMIRMTDAEDIALWHGDFHFGNIFYDFRSRKVRVVDPRGLLPNGMLTIYGDARYDISKLGHSVFGRYDLLIADRYHLDYDGGYDVTFGFGADPSRDEIIALYSEMKIGRYATCDREAIAMVALLFVSMLPLHAKDQKRQIAILANAMRLAKLAEAAS